MNDFLRRKNWKEFARMVELYHLTKLLSDPTWSIRKSATDLNRSVGFVSEYLKLALALRIYQTDIEEMKTRDDALLWLKLKNKCQEYPELCESEMAQIIETLSGELEEINICLNCAFRCK